jgi:hypothetical protein
MEQSGRNGRTARESAGFKSLKQAESVADYCR